jgi:hypothetical protein
MFDIKKLNELFEKTTQGKWGTGCLGSGNSCQCSYILNEGIAGAIATVHIDNGLLISEGGNDAPPREEAIANMNFIAEIHNSYMDIIELITVNEKLLEEKMYNL